MEKHIIRGLKARHVKSIWIMRRGKVVGNYVTLFQSFCYNDAHSITGFRCASPPPVPDGTFGRAVLLPECLSGIF
ncbi:MAG: hypothetical protein K9J27_12030 [Bacteroidales bacterium]|nr:hypothetical protein [Bacteroidales bacterium]